MNKTYTYYYYIPDYEHSGDLEYGKSYIRKNFPEAKNIKGYEERDYDAESDYEDEYGEESDYVYVGYVAFTMDRELTDKELRIIT